MNLNGLMDDYAAFKKIADMNSEGGPRSRVPVEFCVRAVLNEEKSKEAGRPIHDEVEWITKYIPGDPTNRPSRPVRDEDKHEYAEQYRQFKAGLEQIGSGTPIEEATWLTMAQRADYKAVGVKTVENLAAMSDVAAQKFMGSTSHREKAKAYIAAAAGNAPIAKMQDELEAKERRIAQLEGQIAEIASQMSKQKK